MERLGQVLEHELERTGLGLVERVGRERLERIDIDHEPAMRRVDEVILGAPYAAALVLRIVRSGVLVTTVLTADDASMRIAFEQRETHGQRLERVDRQTLVEELLGFVVKG